jgi:hypothetical protein
MSSVGIDSDGCLMAFLMGSSHFSSSLLHITGAFKSDDGGLKMGVITRYTCVEYDKFCGES